MSGEKQKWAGWTGWLAILWLAALILVDALVTPGYFSNLLQKIPASHGLYKHLLPLLTRSDIY